jgi:hypothetical protein
MSGEFPGAGGLPQERNTLAQPFEIDEQDGGDVQGEQLGNSNPPTTAKPSG